MTALRQGQQIRRAFMAELTFVGDDQVDVRLMTGALARDGDVWVPSGVILDNYIANPIILWQHDPNTPIGTASDIHGDATGITARVTFADLGISDDADKVRRLVKGGIVRGVSCGILPLEWEPLDPKKSRGGQRVTKWDLLECSFVSLPSDVGAMVTARATADADWKVGASRDLPIENSDAWDGPEAEKSIFEHAGGDNFDPSAARKGFLVYDAVKPKERGSYKLPIAHVVAGELQVPKGAIRAAASRLPQADIPSAVRDDAAAVLAHYKEKAGMTDADRSARLDQLRTRMLTRGAQAPRLRGLYDVSALCHLLDQLGYAKNMADWETNLEGDDSPVPAMIGEVLVSLGAALVAMTKEEVAELIVSTGTAAAIEDEKMDGADRTYVRAATTDVGRAWRAGLVKSRAGKAISAANAAKLDDAAVHHGKALAHVAAAADAQTEAGQQHEAVGAQHAKIRAAHGKIGDALEAMRSAPETTDDKVAAIAKAHGSMGRALDKADTSHAALGDAADTASDEVTATGRSVRAAQRCVSAVAGDAEDASGDADPDPSAGRSLSLDQRRRRAAELELAAA